MCASIGLVFLLCLVPTLLTGNHDAISENRSAPHRIAIYLMRILIHAALIGHKFVGGLIKYVVAGSSLGRDSRFRPNSQAL